MSSLRLLFGCGFVFALCGAPGLSQAPKGTTDADLAALRRVISAGQLLTVQYKVGELGKEHTVTASDIDGVIDLFGTRYLLLRRPDGERFLVRCDAIVALAASAAPQKTAGSKDTPKKKKTSSLPDDVFKITATEVNLPRGKSAPLRVGVNRGVNFRQEIVLTVRTPQGVTAAPVAQTLGPDAQVAEITLRADGYVPPGSLTVEVIATPERGAAARIKVPVEVVE